MQQDPVLPSNFAYCPDVVDNANFIVHMHERHQRRVRADRSGDLLGADHSSGVGGQIGHRETFLLKLLTAVQHGFVLYHRGNQMPALILVKLRRTLDREIIRFRRARGPNNFSGVTVNQVSHLTTCRLYCLFGFPAGHMRPRSRVTKISGQSQTLHHLVGHSGINRIGRGII